MPFCPFSAGLTAFCPISFIGIFPRLALDENGNPSHIPGLGFVVVIVIVLIVGYVSSSFIVSKLVELFDNILEKTPGIKIIYSTIKDFFEAFAGNKRKFDRAVLVSIESPAICGSDSSRTRNSQNSDCRNTSPFMFPSLMLLPATCIS